MFPPLQDGLLTVFSTLDIGGRIASVRQVKLEYCMQQLQPTSIHPEIRGSSGDIPDNSILM
jgi:hypothetical protein